MTRDSKVEPRAVLSLLLAALIVLECPQFKLLHIQHSLKCVGHQLSIHVQGVRLAGAHIGHAGCLDFRQVGRVEVASERQLPNLQTKAMEHGKQATFYALSPLFGAAALNTLSWTVQAAGLELY